MLPESSAPVSAALSILVQESRGGLLHMSERIGAVLAAAAAGSAIGVALAAAAAGAI